MTLHVAQRFGVGEYEERAEEQVRPASGVDAHRYNLGSEIRCGIHGGRSA